MPREFIRERPFKNKVEEAISGQLRHKIAEHMLNSKNFPHNKI
jgi:hypothetical protein